ncbi:hypothetical protein [Cupriavidus pauculus]|uniref:hypothetical protein n=1 Tax=Cupriavidus pauculus TaxID=82633 RepID=UPI0038572B53
MFCDWLNVWQQFDGDWPDFLGGRVLSIEGACGLARQRVIDADGVIGEAWGLAGGDDIEIDYDVARFAQQRGSYETNLMVRMVAGKLEVRGNPSAYGRLDNLFGVGIDDGIAIYNEVLEQLGLPTFTEGEVRTNYHAKRGDGRGGPMVTYSGAHITRVDVTQNYAVGMGNVAHYHRWLAQQKVSRSGPNDADLEKFASWNYDTVYTSTSKYWINVKHYDKGEALMQRSLPEYLKRLKAAARDGRIAKGDVRPLYQEAEDYLEKLALWCAEIGVTRGEWSMRNRWFVQHQGAGFWMPGETEGKLWDVVGAEMEKISKRAVVYQDESRDSLTLRERGALDAWRRGENLRESLSNGTFYRLRSSILEKTGHDIAARPLVKQSADYRPVFFQVRALSLKDAPIWYQRPSFPEMRLAA